MSLGRQHENLKNFREGANVLISTSVAEEGVDVATCQCGMFVQVIQLKFYSDSL